ncbi:MAG TPA: ribonuclease HII [Elusimicrobia bacterium]|jgi:ribonuclease HII|nr:ribonuclease HII [Elusimicrobiota bacterium]
MSCFIGIDEAGWGPVLGPLVLAGVKLKESSLKRLKKLGVKDSKLFGNGEQAREKRRKLRKKILPYLICSSVKIISAGELDKDNTIDLEIRHIAEILKELNWEKANCIICGMLGTLKKEKFISRISRLLKLRGIRKNLFSSNLRYEKKADKNHLPVSAASILAKVTRDEEIEKLCSKLGEEYVSGYPNSNTATFLKRYCQKYHCLPPQIRKTRNWAPLQRIIKKLYLK